jgi:hypothetical protein
MLEKIIRRIIIFLEDFLDNRGKQKFPNPSPEEVAKNSKEISDEYKKVVGKTVGVSKNIADTVEVYDSCGMIEAIFGIECGEDYIKKAKEFAVSHGYTIGYKYK